MTNYGIISLLPALVAIIVAVKTRKAFESMFLGTIVGFLILSKERFILDFTDALLDVMADSTIGWIILITGLFGSFLAILEKSGGAEAFTKLVSKYSNTGEKSMFITLLLGSVLFIDEYLNVLTIGTAMKKVTDKNRVPREMLAYIINSTGTPICVLLPFSTWSVFFIGLMEQEGILVNGSAVSAYVATIPFILYAWFTIIIVPFAIKKVIPPMGKMKKAWEKIENNKSSVILDGKFDEEKTDGTNIHGKTRISNFVIPVITLIIVTLATGINLTAGIIVGLITCLSMYTIRKLMNIEEYMHSFWSGFESMIMPIGIVVMAFTFKTVNDGLGLSTYIVECARPLMSGAILPAVAFIIVAILAFTTGTLWGLVAIVLPIVVPLSQTLGINPLLVTGAVFSGAVFGSHACFYSDVVVLTARATDISPVDHAISILPYALIASLLSVIGYLVLGFGIA